MFALEFTMPAWTTLLATLFLRERLTPSRIGAIICGLIGVLIILRPGLEAFKPAALLVLVAAFGYATSNIATKKLTATRDDLHDRVLDEPDPASARLCSAATPCFS